ncbi:hypothetical protein ABK040_003005 [Willaertia magna]
MEFPVNIQKIVKSIHRNGKDEENYISVWNKEFLNILKEKDIENYEILCNVIDKIGEASVRAQQIPQPITSYGRLLCTDNNLYLYIIDNKVLGLLKVGKKKLFYRFPSGEFREIFPLCVLDFYVHESCQRKGVGSILFEYVLREENVTPEKLAYDRPSIKLISFLRKHYGLADYIPQSNNFVVFKQYFTKGENKHYSAFETTATTTPTKGSPIKTLDSPSLSFNTPTKESFSPSNNMKNTLRENQFSPNQTSPSLLQNINNINNTTSSPNTLNFTNNASPSRKYVHYNPITNQYTEYVVDQSPQKTGKKMFSPSKILALQSEEWFDHIGEWIEKLSLMNVKNNNLTLYDKIKIENLLGFCHYCLGNLEQTENHYKECENLLSTMVKTQTTNIKEDKSNQIIIQSILNNNIGVIYLHFGKIESALSKFNESLTFCKQLPSLNTFSILPLLNLSYVSLKLNNDLDKAEEYLLQIIQQNDTIFEAWLLLSELYLQHEEFEEALQCCYKAKKLKPENINTLILLAIIKYEMGWDSEALHILDEIKKRDSENQNIYCLFGLIFRKRKMYEKAIISFLKAIELAPYHLFSLECLMDLYFEIGQLGKVSFILEKILNLFTVNNNNINSNNTNINKEDHYLSPIMDLKKSVLSFIGFGKEINNSSSGNKNNGGKNHFDYLLNYYSSNNNLFYNRLPFGIRSKLVEISALNNLSLVKYQSGDTEGALRILLEGHGIDTQVLMFDIVGNYKIQQLSHQQPHVLKLLWFYLTNLNCPKTGLIFIQILYNNVTKNMNKPSIKHNNILFWYYIALALSGTPWKALDYSKWIFEDISERDNFPFYLQIFSYNRLELNQSGELLDDKTKNHLEMCFKEVDERYLAIIYEKCLFYYNQRDLQRATDILQQNKELTQSLPEFQFLFAKILYKKKSAIAARQSLQIINNLIKTCPKHYDYLYYRLKLLACLGDLNFQSYFKDFNPITIEFTIKKFKIGIKYFLLQFYLEKANEFLEKLNRLIEQQIPLWKEKNLQTNNNQNDNFEYLEQTIKIQKLKDSYHFLKANLLFLNNESYREVMDEIENLQINYRKKSKVLLFEIQIFQLTSKNRYQLIKFFQKSQQVLSFNLLDDSKIFQPIIFQQVILYCLQNDMKRQSITILNNMGSTRFARMDTIYPLVKIAFYLDLIDNLESYLSKLDISLLKYQLLQKSNVTKNILFEFDLFKFRLILVKMKNVINNLQNNQNSLQNNLSGNNELNILNEECLNLFNLFLNSFQYLSNQYSKEILKNKILKDFIIIQNKLNFTKKKEIYNLLINNIPPNYLPNEIVKNNYLERKLNFELERKINVNNIDKYILIIHKQILESFEENDFNFINTTTFYKMTHFVTFTKSILQQKLINFEKEVFYLLEEIILNHQTLNNDYLLILNIYLKNIVKDNLNENLNILKDFLIFEFCNRELFSEHFLNLFLSEMDPIKFIQLQQNKFNNSYFVKFNEIINERKNIFYLLLKLYQIEENENYIYQILKLNKRFEMNSTINNYLFRTHLFKVYNKKYNKENFNNNNLINNNTLWFLKYDSIKLLINELLNRTMTDLPITLSETKESTNESPIDDIDNSSDANNSSGKEIIDEVSVVINEEFDKEYLIGEKNKLFWKCLFYIFQPKQEEDNKINQFNTLQSHNDLKSKMNEIVKCFLPYCKLNLYGNNENQKEEEKDILERINLNIEFLLHDWCLRDKIMAKRYFKIQKKTKNQFLQKLKKLIIELIKCFTITNQINKNENIHHLTVNFIINEINKYSKLPIYKQSNKDWKDFVEHLFKPTTTETTPSNKNDNENNNIEHVKEEIILKTTIPYLLSRKNNKEQQEEKEEDKQQEQDNNDNYCDWRNWNSLLCFLSWNDNNEKNDTNNNNELYNIIIAFFESILFQYLTYLNMINKLNTKQNNYQTLIALFNLNNSNINNLNLSDMNLLELFNLFFSNITTSKYHLQNYEIFNYQSTTTTATSTSKLQKQEEKEEEEKEIYIQQQPINQQKESSFEKDKSNTLYHSIKSIFPLFIQLIEHLLSSYENLQSKELITIDKEKDKKEEILKRKQVEIKHVTLILCSLIQLKLINFNQQQLINFKISKIFAKLLSFLLLNNIFTKKEFEYLILPNLLIEEGSTFYKNYLMFGNLEFLLELLNSPKIVIEKLFSFTTIQHFTIKLIELKSILFEWNDFITNGLQSTITLQEFLNNLQQILIFIGNTTSIEIFKWMKNITTVELFKINSINGIYFELHIIHQDVVNNEKLQTTICKSFFTNQEFLSEYYLSNFLFENLNSSTNFVNYFPFFTIGNCVFKMIGPSFNDILTLQKDIYHHLFIPFASQHHSLLSYEMKGLSSGPTNTTSGNVDTTNKTSTTSNSVASGSGTSTISSNNYYIFDNEWYKKLEQLIIQYTKWLIIRWFIGIPINNNNLTINLMEGKFIIDNINSILFKEHYNNSLLATSNEFNNLSKMIQLYITGGHRLFENEFLKNLTFILSPQMVQHFYFQFMLIFKYSKEFHTITIMTNDSNNETIDNKILSKININNSTKEQQVTHLHNNIYDNSNEMQMDINNTLKEEEENINIEEPQMIGDKYLYKLLKRNYKLEKDLEKERQLEIQKQQQIKDNNEKLLEKKTIKKNEEITFDKYYKQIIESFWRRINGWVTVKQQQVEQQDSFERNAIKCQNVKQLLAELLTTYKQ